MKPIKVPDLRGILRRVRAVKARPPRRDPQMNRPGHLGGVGRREHPFKFGRKHV